MCWTSALHTAAQAGYNIGAARGPASSHDKNIRFQESINNQVILGSKNYSRFGLCCSPLDKSLLSWHSWRTDVSRLILTKKVETFLENGKCMRNKWLWQSPRLKGIAKWCILCCEIIILRKWHSHAMQNFLSSVIQRNTELMTMCGTEITLRH